MSPLPSDTPLHRPVSVHWRRRAGAWVTSLALWAATAVALAAPAQDRFIELSVGTSQLIRPASAPERVVMGDPQVCDVIAQPSGALMVVAKQPGETQMTVSGRDGGTAVYRVISSIPTMALNQALREAFPEEKDLQARSTGGAVFLSGTVSDATVADAAQRIAQSLFASSGRKVAEIVSLLQVSSPQQVQVHLRFVEVTRTNLRSMGFNAWFNNANNTTAGALFGPSAPYHYCITCDNQRFEGPSNPPGVPSGSQNAGSANPYLPILVAPIAGTFGISFASTQTKLPISATLALMQGRNLAKVLSEPTLVAVSGQEAKFLVGGEFPIPIPNALGQVTLDFKSYGSQLAFTPTVLTQDTVTLKLDSIVSDIDRANGVTLQSASVPALSSRQSTTTVRLRDGQSFAIAGLLNETVQTTQQRIPGLGDLPLVGMLFRSTQSNRRELELVVIVTVNLVKPLEGPQMPGSINQDEFTDPSDLELFLLGTIDKAKNSRRAGAAGTAPRRGPAHARNEPDGLVGFSR